MPVPAMDVGIFLFGLVGCLAVAQETVATATSASSLGGTQTVGSAAFSTTAGFSLEDYWNQYVGPVASPPINTTVEATPVPSSELILPPPLYYASFPSGQHPFLQPKNESWSFPKDFWWGVSGAAYQIEGAVKDEGRGPSIWDVFSHRVNGYVVTNDTGDITNNEYYMYKQDIARLAALGVKVYSFSISWSRIFPWGSGEINELGLKHYDDVIETCLEYGIEPAITLFHWDLPLFLQNKYGGWLSPEIVDDFVEYARVAFTRWGPKVKQWYTINERSVYCGYYPLTKHYFSSIVYPAEQQPYICSHNVLLAHAQAYRLGKKLLSPNSTITFKNNGGYKIPRTNSSADAEAVQRSWDFNEGHFAHPIFIDGDYPPHLKAYVSKFLPEFTPEQKAAIRGSADFFAHDAYTSNFVFAPDSGIEACVADPSHELYPGCYNESFSYNSEGGNWAIGAASDPLTTEWLYSAVDWVPRFLHYIQDTWAPEGGIAITEFGFAEPFENLKTNKIDILTDPIRSAYFRNYLSAVLLAMSEGVNVIGCLAWSFVDNLEWSSGFAIKFGLQYVNFTTQERAYKASFFEYANMFKQYQET
ncbi:glycoside hydrolase family 1 protein [Aplosporella prunicola CBS 121167]|uniref:Glycoside hydrolase family 1 protein n=1 Tax=Aplosporella prunicola CBS 121167 TaxID=1176127 RepID=A0A6A6BJ03_9PEZI|nr:glycoside hydrolase family 1 protein [Aplosporella prunicola CBS 121167]KAF2143393.1 glycoside hydrolase family 1 protein [Aplosporella prunicola CBS 121167]